MINFKILEIRDEGTFIPAIAFQLGSTNEAERYLCARAGFGKDNESHQAYIFLTDLNCKKGINYNAFDWGDRTYHVAHLHIKQNWEEIKSGDVIDVQYLLGETKEKKLPESMENNI